MIRLLALSIGETIPRNFFDAVVHSVFRRACNVISRDGELITFLSSNLSDLPQGVRVRTPENFSFEKIGIHDGQVAACRAGIVRFEKTGLQIDLRSALVWRVDLTSLQVDMKHSLSQSALRSVHQELTDYHPPDGSGIFGLTAFRPALMALQQAARPFDVEAAVRASIPLIGLGPGATPSGDDFIAGWMCGLWSTVGVDSQRIAFVEQFGEHIIQLADRTNVISKAYLIHAARGRFSQLMADVIEGVAHPLTKVDVRQITRRAMQIGHTSGRDMMAGLVTGLQGWVPESERLNLPSE
jgi:hypothetical protein